MQLHNDMSIKAVRLRKGWSPQDLNREINKLRLSPACFDFAAVERIAGYFERPINHSLFMLVAKAFALEGDEMKTFIAQNAPNLSNENYIELTGEEKPLSELAIRKIGAPIVEVPPSSTSYEGEGATLSPAELSPQTGETQEVALPTELDAAAEPSAETPPASMRAALQSDKSSDVNESTKYAVRIICQSSYGGDETVARMFMNMAQSGPKSQLGAVITGETIKQIRKTGEVPDKMVEMLSHALGGTSIKK